MPFFTRHDKETFYETLTCWGGLYAWYEQNVLNKEELWLPISRSYPPKGNAIFYIDAVEVSLCFGWIDSTNLKYQDLHLSRFSPRRKNSHWTELNKARCRRLIRLGKMTAYALPTLPDLDKSHFRVSPWLAQQTYEIANIREKLAKLPSLYVRIRLSNIDFTYNIRQNRELAQRQLEKFIRYTLIGKTYGQWDDYGRLTDDA